MSTVVPELSRNRVHLWTSALFVEWQAPDAGILSAAEKERAGRFRRRSDAERYISARLILRMILAGYTGFGPGEVGIGISPEGKPHLEPEQGLSFSISYSGDIFLCAVTSGGEVGVDVQVHAGIDQGSENAELFMSENEAGAFISLSGRDRERFFFDSWARREAVAKACGKGLKEAPRSISIEPSVRPGGHWTALAPSSAIRWNVFDIPVMEGYSAAAAVETECLHVELLEFSLSGRPSVVVA